MPGVRARFGKYQAIVTPAFPDALCRGSWLPPDTWADPRSDEQREAAAYVCAGCVHRIECAEFGVRHAGTLPGIWGGLTRAERLRRRREQRRLASLAGDAA